MSINTLSIYPLNKCNLKCKYCAIKENLQKPYKKLSFNNLKSAFITFTQISNTKEKNILFYGGEPLFYIKEILKLRKTYKDEKIKFSLTSNGVLITEKIMKELIKENINFSISLDGKKKFNDKNRQLKESNNSVFELIFNKFLKYSQKANKIHIKMVITPQNTKFLFENFKFFTEIGVKEIHFLPQLYVKFDLKYLKMFEKNISLIVNYLKKSKNQYISTELKDIKSRLKFYIKKEIWWENCPQINLGFDNNFYICDECFRININKKMGIIGNISTGVNLKLREKMFAEAKDYIIKNIQNSYLYFWCPYGAYFYSIYKGVNPKNTLYNLYILSKIIVKNYIKLFI